MRNSIDSLYTDWKDGDITRDEYHRMKMKFEEQAAQLQNAIRNLNKEIDALMPDVPSREPLLEGFLKYRNITHLERGMLIELVDQINVYAGGKIQIEFNFADPYQSACKFIENHSCAFTAIKN